MTRRRFIQVGLELVEVSPDYVAVDESAPRFHILGDKNYEGTRSPIDGADISTRTKHRMYMKDHNLAITDDFKGEWHKQAQDRVAGKDPTRKEAIIRAVNQHYRR